MAGFDKLLFAVIFLAANTGWSQVNRYIVHFKDKSGTPFSTSSPSSYLSEKGIERRLVQNIAITEEDLPVNPAYVGQVKATGAEVYFTSRWRNCALVQTTPTIIEQIELLSFVSSAELVAPGSKLTSGRMRKIKNRKDSGIAPETLSQLSMIGIDKMHEEDIRGEGIEIAVFDSGFDGVNVTEPFAHLFSAGRLSSAFDFIGNSADVYRYDDHGTEVFSIIGAHSATYTGGAYEATFHLFVTEDVTSEYRIEEYNWLFAAERADSAGVDVIHSSLGYNTFDDVSMDYDVGDLNGNTAVVSFAAAEAIERGIVVVCSAGNEGNNSWKFVTPPADVDGIFAVGSVTSTGAKSTFSSVGPTSDNRIKPDVVALGSSVKVIHSDGSDKPTSSGTSVAAPFVTSLAAGLLQRFPGVSVSKLYDAITSSASQGDDPDNFLGYGIPNYESAKQALEIYNPEEEISIFPNPVNEQKAKVYLKKSNQVATVTIFDIQGRILNEAEIEVTWQNNPFEIDFSNLSAGTYLVRVKTTDNFKTTRIIKL